MLIQLAPNLWHVQHAFIAGGLTVTSRMTVVRLVDGSLWLHSPVRISAELRAELSALGTVSAIVAPNKMHHLFAAAALRDFPQARLYGAPGLSAKLPQLQPMTTLTPAIPREWEADLEQIFVDGIPLGNETVWLHKASRTLIMTDLCQWWQGELPIAARMFAALTGVRNALAVPRTIRWLVKNKSAARASAQRILQWPFERVIVAHNCVIEVEAHRAVERAFAWFDA